MKLQKTNFKTLLTATVLGSALMFAGCQQQTSEEHIAAAQAFIENGNSGAAVVELKNAIQVDPNLAKARFELGKVYLDTNNYEAAEKELSKAIELGHPSAQVIPLLTRAYQRTGANAALVQVDHTNADLTPVEQIEVGFYKVQSLVQLDKRREAQALINELMQIETRSVYKGLVETIEIVLDENYPKALAKAIELQQQAPLNKDVLGLTARLYLLNQQPDEAANVYQEYVKAAPKDSETRFALANLLVEQKRTSEAEPHVDELLKINSQNGLLNQLKGVIRAADNDFENAQKYSEVAIANGRATPVVRLIAGYAAFQQGDFEAAEGHLSQIAELLPDNHPGLRILAASQLQSGKAEEATGVLGRIDSLTENDAMLFSKAGYELLQAGNVQQAQEAVDRAEGISETSEDLTRLGVLKLSLNNIDGVIDLEKAVAKTPASATAKTTLATAYLATNQLEKAAELAEQWKNEVPNSVSALLLEGDVKQRQGDVNGARNAYTAARTLEPNNVNAEIALIGLDIRAEDFKTAATKLESVISRNPSYVPALTAYFSVQQRLGDAQKGMKPSLEALAADSNNAGLLMLVSRMYVSNEQLKQADTQLTKIKADKDAPAAYWQLFGYVLLQSEQVTRAEQHYDTWLTLFPSQRDALLGKLLILDAQNKFADALKLTQSFMSERDDIQVKILQAYFYVMTEDSKSAKRILNSFDAQIQPLPFLRGVAARIAILEGRPADAIEDALLAYNASSNSKNMLLVVQAYTLSKQEDKSYEFLVTHLAKNPNDLRALMLVAGKELETKPASAIQRYQQALELNQNNFIVLNNLAYLLMEEGKLSDAASYAKRAYDLRPENVATVDTYAQILIRQNRVAEAVEAYQRSDVDDTDNEEVFLNYVEALLMDGKKPVASRRLEEREFKLPASNQRMAELKRTYQLN